MIKLGNLVNEESLTIFTDASISPNRDGTYYGCPGFVAVDANGIIDSGYIVIDDTTSNNSEIKAIRMGVMAANKYKEKYKYIRLFSDSQLCIFGLRDRFYSWFDNIYKGNLCGYNREPIANQSIFIEIANFIVNNNLHIEFYHQKGHVSLTNPKQLDKAKEDFIKFNNLNSDVDIELIKWISYYNNMVDQTSREFLNKTLFQIPTSLSAIYTDACSFKIKNDFDIKGFYQNTHNIK